MKRLRRLISRLLHRDPASKLERMPWEPESANPGGARATVVMFLRLRRSESWPVSGRRHLPNVEDRDWLDEARGRE
jgi:hypothetical protein